MQDDDHLSNCRLTRSAFKKQQLQQAEGKGEKACKKEREKASAMVEEVTDDSNVEFAVTFTPAELQRYNTMVQQSDVCIHILLNLYL